MNLESENGESEEENYQESLEFEEHSDMNTSTCDDESESSDDGTTDDFSEITVYKACGLF